jgi:SnoaL-like domain
MSEMMKEDLIVLCDSWLSSWTGNHPERLIEFYTDDAFYMDPAVPNGLRGRVALLTYFSKLLKKNPNWVWKRVDLFPLQDGFILKWKATIPLNGEVVECVGMDLVELKDHKISRNEVYFDPSLITTGLTLKSAQPNSELITRVRDNRIKK